MFRHCRQRLSMFRRSVPRAVRPCGADVRFPVFDLTLHFDRLPGQFCRLLERLAGHYIEH